VPIVNGESCNNGNTGCTPTLIQQPYGVTLNFTPIVLSEGRIQLRIATEVTDVDNSVQITFGGIAVPGFRTRNNTTTVELPSGGSIASAGLISTQTQQAINGFPALMNVPVLGALFRSRDYLRNETELLIVVTPYIVHAVDPSQVVRPDQNFQDASDPQSWFLGRVNRIYSTSRSLQPRPGYSGKIGFINSRPCRASPEIFSKLRRTALMAALRDARSMFTAQVLKLTLVAAAASALSGCGVQYASSDPAFPGDFQERHPIVVAAAPTSVDLYPVGGVLDERSIANIRAFAERYRRYGAGAVVIQTPAGVNPNSIAVHEIRRALVAAGVKGRVALVAYLPMNDGAAPPVRVSFTGLKAIVPTKCGEWPEDLASGSSVAGWKNEPYSNFGCATQSTIAAQVDDPRDFVQPRALGPSDVAMRTRAIEAVRAGQDPGTQWKDTVPNPIGGSQLGGQ
jgi:pilus biogenesis lipoprotein CpaD